MVSLLSSREPDRSLFNKELASLKHRPITDALSQKQTSGRGIKSRIVEGPAPIGHLYPTGHTKKNRPGHMSVALIPHCPDDRVI